MKETPLNKVYRNIDSCFKSLDYQAKVYDGLTTIPYDEILNNNENYEKSRALETVIIDKDIKYWFEDAYQDIIKKIMLKTEDSSVDNSFILENKQLEKDS